MCVCMGVRDMPTEESIRDTSVDIASLRQKGGVIRRGCLGWAAVPGNCMVSSCRQDAWQARLGGAQGVPEGREKWHRDGESIAVEVRDGTAAGGESELVDCWYHRLLG